MTKMSWDERYGEPEYAYGTEPNDFLRGEAHRIPMGGVLELAAGEGRNGVWLAAQGYEVTLVDGSGVGLDKARRLAAERGVEVQTVHGDLAHLSIEPGRWQGIVAIFAHVPRALRRRMHAAVVVGLAPGGVYLYEAYTPAQIAHGTGGPRDPEMLPTLAELREELAGLDFELAVEREREVHEGKLHNGTSAVVQVVATKRA